MEGGASVEGKRVCAEQQPLVWREARALACRTTRSGRHLDGCSRGSVHNSQRGAEGWKVICLSLEAAGPETQLVGVVPTSLVYMPTYEAVSRLARAVDGAQWGLPAALPASQLASVATGVASSCVRVPISVVKARHFLDTS